MNAYQELGVEPGCTDDAVRAAYRARAQATHPDKEGGSEEAFKRVGRAYDTLRTAAARAYYDTHGHAEGAEPAELTVEQEAEQLLGKVFQQWLDADEQGDPLADLNTAMKEVLKSQEVELRKATRQAARAGLLVKALTRKKPGPSTLLLVLTAQQAKLVAHQAQLTRRVQVIKAVLVTLSGWSFDAGKLPKKTSKEPAEEDINDLINSMLTGRRGWKL